MDESRLKEALAAASDVKVDGAAQNPDDDGPALELPPVDEGDFRMTHPSRHDGFDYTVNF